jgi:RNA polymerase sigma-70 factor (ECF subfamily)
MHQLSSDDFNLKPAHTPDYVGRRPTPLAELLARAKEHPFFAMLYDYYQEPLGKRLRNLVGDKETAVDLYQETFLRAWVHFSQPEVDPQEIVQRFEPWIYSVAKNLAFDYYRSKRRIDFLPLPESEPNGSKEYALSARLSVTGHEDLVCDLLCLEEALAAMSPQYRVCLMLQVQWGYSQLEIGRALGISVKAVSTNVSRGFTQLRKIYKEMMSDQPTKKAKKGGRKRHGKINLRTF